MEELLPFLQKNEVLIYLLLGVIAIFPFRQLVMAWKDWQGTVFGIEREIAQRRFSSALTILVLLVLFIVMEFFIVSFVAPNYPQIASLPTSTLDLLATPTVTLSSLIDSAASQATVAPTPTFDTASLKEGCEKSKIEWTYPESGKEISGTVELKGTVNVPNLGFYKYEYAKPGDKDKVWTEIAAGDKVRVNEQIGFWNTSQVDPGEYLLRLVVADNQNQLFPACVIPVKVAAQPN